jgi:lambda repressor-like predicted transcriptional regulator
MTASKNGNERTARIKYELALRGLTCAQLDRRNGLYAGQCVNAIREPDEDGERAIATALGQSPQQIWPERFDATGIRFIPQPRANYRPRGSAESRRNRRAA